MKRNKDKQKRMLREKWYAEIGYGVSDTYRYKNKYMDQYLNEEKLKKKQDEEKEEQKKIYHEKMANYAKFVKEMHFPEVSERKRKEMETMVSLIKSSRQGTKKRSLNTIREHDRVSQSSGGSLT